MLSFFDRITNWKNSALATLKRRNWKAWGAVVVVSYILLETIRAFVSDAGTLLLVWVLRGLEWLAQQPVGLAGLGIVVYIVLLIGISWLQTRPRPTPPVDAPKPLTDDERRLVQDLRTVWNRHGILAINQIHDILRESLYELERREFWTELLRPVAGNLEKRRAEFESVLEPSKHAGIALAREHFNGMYAAYIKVMKWVAILQSRDLLQLHSRSEERIQVWRQNHRDMVNRLHDLNEDPAHSGTLHIFLNWIDEPEFRSFIREAETSPEWLALMRESERRSVVAVDPSTPDT